MRHLQQWHLQIFYPDWWVAWRYLSERQMNHQILHPLQSTKICFFESILHGLVCTSSHDKTSIFIAPNTEMFGSDLLPSIASIIFWTTFILYLAFKEWMTPWSIGCKTEVVFGGRKKRSIAFNPPISEWAVQLSMMSATFPGFFLVFFQIDYQALWPILRKALNPSSFCSGLGNGKVIFWYSWNI